MKDKYDIIQVFILYIISLIILIIISINIKITTYKTFSLIHLNNDKYEIIIKEKDQVLFNHTKSIYLNNNKYKYKIIESNFNIKEINNIIEGSIISNRIKLIQIFTSIYT